MSGRDRVQRLLRDLHEADTVSLAALGADLGNHDGEAWVELADGIRFGQGAVAMHRRNLADTPPPAVTDLEDVEALAWSVLALAANGGTDLEAAEAALADVRRTTPDFFDELLLGAATLMSQDDRFRKAVYAQADAIEADRIALHEQAIEVLDLTPGLTDRLRGWVGAAPDLSGGAWKRWGWAICWSGVLGKV